MCFIQLKDDDGNDAPRPVKLVSRRRKRAASKPGKKVLREGYGGRLDASRVLLEPEELGGPTSGTLGQNDVRAVSQRPIPALDAPTGIQRPLGVIHGLADPGHPSRGKKFVKPDIAAAHRSPENSQSKAGSNTSTGNLGLSQFDYVPPEVAYSPREQNPHIFEAEILPNAEYFDLESDSSSSGPEEELGEIPPDSNEDDYTPPPTIDYSDADADLLHPRAHREILQDIYSQVCRNSASYYLDGPQRIHVTHPTDKTEYAAYYREVQKDVSESAAGRTRLSSGTHISLKEVYDEVEDSALWEIFALWQCRNIAARICNSVHFLQQQAFCQRWLSFLVAHRIRDGVVKMRSISVADVLDLGSSVVAIFEGCPWFDVGDEPCEYPYPPRFRNQLSHA